MKVIPQFAGLVDASESWQALIEPPRASGIQEGAPINLIIQLFA